MNSMAFRDDIDSEKLAEAALAILSLTMHDTHIAPRVWKGLDWELLELLHEKGWVSDPKSKAKSVLISEEGREFAELFLKKHFGKT